jgi:hypothetical protein
MSKPEAKKFDARFSFDALCLTNRRLAATSRGSDHSHGPRQNRKVVLAVSCVS